MPTVLRLDGLRITIYPNHHRPAHVHARSGEAIFELNCPDGPARLRESYGLPRPALNAIAAKLDAHVPGLCLSREKIHAGR